MDAKKAYLLKTQYTTTYFSRGKLLQELSSQIDIHIDPLKCSTTLLLSLKRKNVYYIKWRWDGRKESMLQKITQNVLQHSKSHSNMSRPQCPYFGISGTMVQSVGGGEFKVSHMLPAILRKLPKELFNVDCVPLWPLNVLEQFRTIINSLGQIIYL